MGVSLYTKKYGRTGEFFLYLVLVAISIKSTLFQIRNASSKLWRSSGRSLFRLPSLASLAGARERWYSSERVFMPVTSLTDDEQMMRDSGNINADTDN